MAPTIALLGALDTKADDVAFVARRLRARGLDVLLIDTGVLGEAGLTADITRGDLAAAGGSSIDELRRRGDRATAVDAMARGAREVVRDLHAAGRVSGVFALGGGAGTAIGAAAMRELPLGVPKLILSTVASGDTQSYVGTSDIVMFPSLVDVAGINRISAISYARAADAFAGMVAGAAGPADTGDIPRRPVVAASMFGVTTPAVTAVAERLGALGNETLIFHATGIGGRLMERLIAEGHIDAVVDLTTTEWADEIVGGILSAGPHRLEAAIDRGLPQVVSLGATDIVNFGAFETVPKGFAGRTLYRHNPDNTLMRTSVEEAAAIGRAIGARLARTRVPIVVLVPTRGVSALDVENGPFDDPAARAALVRAVREEAVGELVRIVEVDAHINDPAFADRVVAFLTELRATSPDGRNTSSAPSTPTAEEATS